MFSFLFILLYIEQETGQVDESPEPTVFTPPPETPEPFSPELPPEPYSQEDYPVDSSERTSRRRRSGLNFYLFVEFSIILYKLFWNRSHPQHYVSNVSYYNFTSESKKTSLCPTYSSSAWTAKLSHRLPISLYTLSRART